MSTMRRLIDRPAGIDDKRSRGLPAAGVTFGEVPGDLAYSIGWSLHLYLVIYRASGETPKNKTFFSKTWSFDFRRKMMETSQT